MEEKKTATQQHQQKKFQTSAFLDSSKIFRFFSIILSFTFCIIPYHLGWSNTVITKNAIDIICALWLFSVGCSVVSFWTIGLVPDEFQENWEVAYPTAGWMLTCLLFIAFLLWAKIVLYPELVLFPSPASDYLNLY